MAISAVSSVSFRNNYNNIQFEGRKNVKKYDAGAQPSHSSTSVKAASLAAIMLMSPLNTSSAEYNAATMNGYPVEMAQSSGYSNKVLEKFTFKNATPKRYTFESRPCNVYFVSTDGNDDDAEKISLVFTDPMHTRKSIDGKLMNLTYEYEIGVDADTLEIHNVTTSYSSGRSSTEKRYYITGSGYVNRSGYYTESGQYIDRDGYFKKRNLRREVSKELYDYIAECMQDEAIYKVTSEQIDGDKKLEEELLFW